MQNLLVFSLAIGFITLVFAMAILVVLDSQLKAIRQDLESIRNSFVSRQGSLKKTKVAGPLYRKERARTTQRSYELSTQGRMSKLGPQRGGEYGNPNDGELS